MTSLPAVSERCRVTVWFGEHLVMSYSAEPAAAEDYAQSMARRYAGLRVRIDDKVVEPLRSLPCERLWGTITS